MIQAIDSDGDWNEEIKAHKDTGEASNYWLLVSPVFIKKIPPLQIWQSG